MKSRIAPVRILSSERGSRSELTLCERAASTLRVLCEAREARSFLRTHPTEQDMICAERGEIVIDHDPKAEAPL